MNIKEVKYLLEKYDIDTSQNIAKPFESVAEDTKETSDKSTPDKKVEPATPKKTETKKTAGGGGRANTAKGGGSSNGGGRQANKPSKVKHQIYNTGEGYDTIDPASMVGRLAEAKAQASAGKSLEGNGIQFRSNKDVKIGYDATIKVQEGKSLKVEDNNPDINESSIGM